MKGDSREGHFSSPGEARTRLVGFQQKLLDDAKAILRKRLDLVFVPSAERENVVTLCLAQLQRGVFSEKTLQKELEELDQQKITQSAWEKWQRDEVDGACREAASAPYVRDCDLVALYQRCDSGEIRRTLRDYYWCTCKPWDSAVGKVAAHFQCAREQAEFTLASYKSDIERMEHFDGVVSDYKPSEGATFAGWVVSTIAGFVIPESIRTHKKDGRIGPLRDIDITDNKPRPVENEVDGRAFRDDCIECLKQLRDEEPVAYAIFILRWSKQGPDIDREVPDEEPQFMKAILDGLSSIEGVRKSPSGRKRYDPDRADIMWDRLHNLPQIDRTWKELFRKHDESMSGFAETRVRELKLTAECRTQADMEMEKKECNNEDRQDRAKELEFMIEWSLYQEADKARFRAIEGWTNLTEREISGFLGISQSEVAKKWAVARARFSRCLREKGWQGI